MSPTLSSFISPIDSRLAESNEKLSRWTASDEHEESCFHGGFQLQSSSNLLHRRRRQAAATENVRREPLHTYFGQWWRTGQDQHDMVTTGLRSTALIISYCLLLLSRTIARSLGTKYPNASLGGQQWMTLVRICTGAFVCTGTCPGGESAQSWACLSSSVHHQHPLSSSSWYYYSDWPLATTPLGTTILWLALCVALFGCQGLYCVLCGAGRQGTGEVLA